MDKIEIYLQELYDSVITNDGDRIILVIGDERVGKSTFILEAMGRYDKVRGREPQVEDILDYVVYDSREEFRKRLVNAGRTDPIAAMDAAHIFYKRDAYDPEQKEAERTLLDVGIEHYVMFLGYQEWADVPTPLQRRRAGNAFYIPRRGVVEGYSRAKLDEKRHDFDDDEWPEPDLRDVFPNLDGTELWERFQKIDRERKKERIRPDSDGEDGESGLGPQEVVQQILEDDVEEYIEYNQFNKSAYWDKSYIRYQFPSLSAQQADQVQSGLRRESGIDLDEYAERWGGEGEGGTPTA